MNVKSLDLWLRKNYKIQMGDDFLFNHLLVSIQNAIILYFLSFQ